MRADASRPESNGLRIVLIRVIRTLGILLATSLAFGADDFGVLQIRVLEGENAAYLVGSRATRGVTILVSDESGRPVAGATVSFSLPSEGPGGVFASGVRTEIATTHADGRAAVWGMRWNRTPGQFELRIMAIKGQARAAIATVQSLAAPSSAAASANDAPGAAASAGRVRGGEGGHHKILWISLAAGAAAAVGIAGAGLAKSNPAAGAAAAASVSSLQIGTPVITVGRP